MSPILGIYASQITGHLYTPANSYESIATVTVGAGGSSSITFSSIPSTYKHLQIRGISRVARASNTFGYPQMRLNSDSGSSYPYHILIGDGATASATGAGAITYGLIGVTAGDTATANVFGVDVIDILDYANTNKYKTIRYLSGYDNNGSGELRFGSFSWLSTSAVTQIDISEYYGTNYKQYSSFALYGVKG